MLKICRNVRKIRRLSNVTPNVEKTANSRNIFVPKRPNRFVKKGVAMPEGNGFFDFF